MPFTNPAFDICLAIIFMIASYLIGSVPFGILIGKIFSHKDIREFGSKNIGSTNAIRVLGKKVGALVFILDCLKGALFIVIVRLLGIYEVWDSPVPLILYGVPAVIGHAFPIYLDFKGGKAVAASLGILFALFPMGAVVCLIAFVLVLVTTGYVSLCSTAAALTGYATVIVMHFVGDNSYLFFQSSIADIIVVGLLVGLILYKHIPNYIRLAKGNENSFKKKKSI